MILSQSRLLLLFCLLSLSIVIRVPIFLLGSTKILTFIGVLTVSLYLLIKLRKYVQQIFVLYLTIFFCYLFLAQLYWLEFDFNVSFHKIFFYQLTMVLVFCCSFYLFYGLYETYGVAKVYKFLTYLLYFVLGILVIEVIGRFFFAEIIMSLRNSDAEKISLIVAGQSPGLEVNNFYLFKVASYMALDSNYVALFAASFVPLLLTIKNELHKLHFFTLISLFVIIVFLTLSRASWVCIAFIILYYALIKNKSLTYKIKIALIFVLSPFIVFWGSSYFLSLNDESLLTKFDILSSTFNIANKHILDILFGYGNNLGYYVYSYTQGGYAHLVIPILLGVVGILGIILYFMLWGIVLYLSKFETLGLFLMFILFGFSLGDPWEFSYMFVAGLIHAIKRIEMNHVEQQKIVFS